MTDPTTTPRGQMIGRFGIENRVRIWVGFSERPINADERLFWEDARPDVDLAEGVIAFRQSVVPLKEGPVLQRPKTADGDDRRVAIDPQTVAVLERHRALQAKKPAGVGGEYRTDLDLVFARPDGSPLDPRSSPIGSFASRARQDFRRPGFTTSGAPARSC